MVDAPGAKVVTGQVMADRFAGTAGAFWVSVTDRLLTVTLPVLVTRNR